MEYGSYIEFLRYCLDDTKPLPDSAKSIDWRKLMVWAEKQAIIGIVYHGIEKAGKSISVPFDILMEWIGYANQIEMRNLLVNKQCVEACTMFHSNGFETCILKGQGNAMMYPKPLLRNPGDIDLLITNRTSKEIIKFVKTKNPVGRAQYHHIDYGEIGGVEVEVHYKPSYVYNPFSNHHLQAWFREHIYVKELMLPKEGKVIVPNWNFNIVFQLSHIYNHFLHEGIGLRQFIDYYYLLKSDESGLGKDFPVLFQHFGLMEIAGAVMWVLREVLGLEEKYLIAPVDEQRGRFLLAEMLEGGNFGYFDRRVNHRVSQFARNVQRLKRDIRLVRYFPLECLWEPVFRVYHFFWRMVS